MATSRHLFLVSLDSRPTQHTLARLCSPAVPSILSAGTISVFASVV